jgi:hypothetical protein
MNCRIGGAPPISQLKRLKLRSGDRCAHEDRLVDVMHREEHSLLLRLTDAGRPLPHQLAHPVMERARIVVRCCTGRPTLPQWQGSIPSACFESAAAALLKVCPKLLRRRPGRVQGIKWACKIILFKAWCSVPAA